MSDNLKNKKILVTGATGHQGSAVVRNLLKRGFQVRALTRNTESEAAQRLQALGVELAEGDFMDPKALAHALSNIYGAYSVQNSWVAGIENEIKQGIAFADAAKMAGVKHFVYSSVEGAERNTGIPHFDSKWVIEKYIRKIDLPFTIIRPVAFMDNLLGSAKDIKAGKLISPLNPETRSQQVAVDDIGYFVAFAFASPSLFMDRSIPLAGDAPTLPEMATTLSKFLGKPVEYTQIPWDTFRAEAGGDMAMMTAWFEEKGYEADIKNLRKMHPGLKTFEMFLNDFGTPFKG